MKKQGIKELKELIDFAYIVYTFKGKKINFWNWLLGNLKKIRKAIEEGVELWNDRKLLWEEIKDIDPVELEELNQYAAAKFGVSEDIEEFISHIIQGTDHYVQAYKISRNF